MIDDMYGVLAPLYDRFLRGEVNVPHWCDSYERRFAAFGPRLIREVLDLGCGTGSMTLELALRGYDMIGADLSEEMLACAMEKAGRTECGKRVLWLCQDMTELDLYGTVDAVVCSLDCLNHLPDGEAVKRCLFGLHTFLIPGGLFLFDVNTPYKFAEVYGQRAYLLEDRGDLCAWQNDFHPRTRECRFYLSLFEKAGGDLYRRHDCMQTEKCYLEKELRKWLAETGFEVLAWDGDLDGGPVTPRSERWHITARALK